jgi:hypothetical protein
MKKTPKNTKSGPPDGKGFLTLAGEALSVLGGEIAEGKDKVMAAAAEKFTTVKKVISQKLSKKKTPVKKKRAAPKKAVKKASRKTTAKAVRKPAIKAKKASKRPASAKKRK